MSNILNRDALEAARVEISKITSDAIEAAIIMYLIRDKRIGDIV